VLPRVIDIVNIRILNSHTLQVFKGQGLQALDKRMIALICLSVYRNTVFLSTLKTKAMSRLVLIVASAPYADLQQLTCTLKFVSSLDYITV
jgi:hypothetical protein